MLRDPVPTAVGQVLANASKGVLIVDGTKVPSMAGWGTNYLSSLADLLNDANGGGLLELADPLAHGAVRIVPVAGGPKTVAAGRQGADGDARAPAHPRA